MMYMASHLNSRKLHHCQSNPFVSSAGEVEVQPGLGKAEERDAIQ
jgi:hypothetical protein